MKLKKSMNKTFLDDRKIKKKKNIEKSDIENTIASTSQQFQFDKSNENIVNLYFKFQY